MQKQAKDEWEEGGGGGRGSVSRQLSLHMWLVMLTYDKWMSL